MFIWDRCIILRLLLGRVFADMLYDQRIVVWNTLIDLDGSLEGVGYGLSVSLTHEH